MTHGFDGEGDGRGGGLIRVEQRLVEFAALKIAHIAERRVADDLPHAAA